MYITDQDTLEISSSDIINRKWLDNHFYGIVYSAEYNADKFQFDFRWRCQSVFRWSLWRSNMGSDMPVMDNIRHRYYDNDATKTDFNLYGKLNYDLNPRSKCLC